MMIQVLILQFLWKLAVGALTYWFWRRFFKKWDIGLVFMTSVSNLVVMSTVYSREQVLVYVFFYSCKKLFWHTMVHVVLYISEHVIDGCVLMSVHKNDYSKLCVVGSFFEFGYHFDSKLITSILCDPKCCLFSIFFSELSFSCTSFALETESWHSPLRL
jgi:hypothetical protein